ncbi:Actin ARP9 [Fusarium albosuccineum]|uniref:Actin ARP9 n=1 Tax=Fusarium albosuccineum TaxID=1237068 RepID=A0A8H4L3Q5_9HYPO|nr:Actin ARP9 [Fusarium albosuccineum]
MTCHNCQTPTKGQSDHVHSFSDSPATQTPSSTPRYSLRARKPPPSSTPSRHSKRDTLQGHFNLDDSGIVSPSPRNQPQSESASTRRFRRRTMSSTAGKWREEQVLIICPGSRTTMAQLGCSELTPPARRMPTRMFKDGEQWSPYFKTKRTAVVNGVEEEEWVEDMDEDEGAVYPIQAGRIVNMSALLAFLDHVHGLLTTTYHNTPIMLMASPQWTRPDCETIARYVFENTRTPALCIIHSGIATQYGLKWPSMTVVDIGFEKVDVTAIHDGRVVNHMDVGASEADREVSGGEVFTRSLLKLLQQRGFNRDMAEQLKKSNICEVLPYVATAENLMDLPKETNIGPAPGGTAPIQESTATSGPQAPKPVEAADGDEANGNGEDDGVLDVAAIVTSGQTKEFLAKKEKEKEKGKPGRKPKGDKDAEGATKPLRLPNSKRTRNTFFYEEIIQEEVPKEKPITEKPIMEKPVNGTTEDAKKEDETNGTQAPQGNTVDAAAAITTPATTDAPKPAEDQGQVQPSEPEPKPEPKPEEANPTVVAPPPPPPPPTNEAPERRPKRIRRDVEVGLERFKFAQRHEIDRIVSAIYRTVQGIDDMYMRPACWDNIVFVGNGSRLRGLRENILQTLNARHLVSPSTATMFTSELPSNMATPTGTGAQTPTGSFTGAPHQLSSSGVNPLLQAATTAAAAGSNPSAVNNANAAATPQASSEAGGPVTGHHFHSQTPTSIKTATLPSYLSEWTKNGFEEAMFLGAQVAARIAFCLHSNMDAQTVEAQRLMSLSRVDYNELGPKGIRTHSMLG